MRIFLYECLSAGDFPPPVSRSLKREGRAMLQAVVDDFRRMSDVVVITSPSNHGLSKRLFQRLAGDAEYTLVIAPELHGLLESRCSWVEEVGGRLLGPTTEAVKLTADKLALASHLKSRGVPTPTTSALPVGERLNADTVVKPRWGAGSQDVFRVVSRSARSTRKDLIVQPLIPGMAASVAWLIGPRQKIPLLPAMQRLSDDGRFHYLGGRIPLGHALAKRAIDLTRRAVEAASGLRGYVGIDIVLGGTAKEDHVIEINPRLTTSYLGLRRLCKDNLAQAMLNVVRGENVARLRWQKRTIEFDCEGRVIVAARFQRA